MKYAQQYLLSAIQIMQNYDGKLPLAAFLKNHFASNKKFGSKDRKHIAHLCYAYCRIGHAAAELPADIRFRIALFLVNDQESGWAGLFEPNWLEHWDISIASRIEWIRSLFEVFDPMDIFPCHRSLSSNIDVNAFTISHLIQPDVFIRIRPGKYETVRKKIQVAEIPYQEISETCFAFSNAVKLDEFLAIDRDVVVQDRSSQRIASVLAHLSMPTTKALQYWDCCAASGGKTLLAKDCLGVMDITVSDIRSSILHNLSSRFERAGIPYFQSLVTDLSQPHAKKPSGLFDLIWADVPCSGSGTWGRTPEQLLFFGEAKIEQYATLQKSILENLMDSMAPGGYLLYSTCSVFKAENEGVRDAVLEAKPQLKIVDEQYLIGYDQKADSMYAVLFRKEA